MAYAVIRHADKSGVGFSNSNPKTASLGRTIKFFKALEDGAVYFNTRDGGKQYVVNVSTSLKSQPEIEKAIRDNLASRNSTRDLIVPSSEITKAAQQLLGFLKHSDESSDDEVIIDEGVEIIEAPYPEHGKAQIPRRCFIYDDEDGYPEGYQGFIEHHGILGMKWGVRRYQNADGSLTDAGRKHYGVKRIKQEASSIKDPYDKQKYSMQEKQKATDKGTFHMSAAAAGGAGLATGALTKAAIANAVASGASSVYLPVLGLAMATPVGQIASIAALTAGTAGTIYSIYREKKINQLMLDNVTDASKKPLKVEVTNNKKPTVAMVPAGTLPESTRITGKEESDFWKSLANNQAFLDDAGHREAAKYGLDQGDNYKVFIDAARGDKEANRIVEEWKKEKK